MSLLLQQVLDDIYEDNGKSSYNNYCQDVGRDINGRTYIANERNIKGDTVETKVENEKHFKIEKIQEYNPIMTEKENKKFNKLKRKFKRY